MIAIHMIGIPTKLRCSDSQLVHTRTTIMHKVKHKAAVPLIIIIIKDFAITATQEI